MKTLACCALLFIASACQADDAIRGIWRGTGLDERYTLIFTGDLLIATIGNHPLAGSKESAFHADNGAIDIERTDGLQLGRYTIEGNRLTLTLAGVNDVRPTSLNDKPRWKFRKYVFDRQPALKAKQ